MMAIAGRFAATAVFAGLAVGVAGTAWAEAPTMDGGYTLTATTPSGQTLTTSWKAGPGGSHARLVDGQWVLDTLNNVSCADGSYIQYASNAHITRDPNTLAGTAQHIYIVPACGRPAGYTETDQIQIRQSS